MSRRALLATRRSLVGRLGNLDDNRSWQEFFDLYGGMLYRVARAAGLSDAEAQEAVQETVITVARNVGDLRYDPVQGSFKGWLLQTVRWRIADQFRRRAPAGAAPRLRGDSGSEGPRTAFIDRVPNPSGGGADFEALWEHEWRGNLLAVALARVRRAADPRQFQIFDCYVTKGWPAARVAGELRVNIAQVYLAKHRIGALLKKTLVEIERAEFLRDAS